MENKVLEVFDLGSYYEIGDDSHRWGSYKTQILAIKHAVNLANNWGKSGHYLSVKVIVTDTLGNRKIEWTYGIDIFPDLYRDLPRKISAKKFLDIWHNDFVDLTEKESTWYLKGKSSVSKNGFSSIELVEDLIIDNEHVLSGLELENSYFKKIYIKNSTIDFISISNTFIEELIIIGSSIYSLYITGENNYNLRIEESTLYEFNVSSVNMKTISITCSKISEIEFNDAKILKILLTDVLIKYTRLQNVILDGFDLIEFRTYSVWATISKIKKLSIIKCKILSFCFDRSKINSLYISKSTVENFTVTGSTVKNVTIDSSQLTI